MKKQIEEIKDCIDSVYGCDCAYYGVEGMAIAQAIYNAGYRKQSEKYLIKENGDIFPLKHHSEWISVEDMVDAPTADVVEVVRCKDCRHCKFNSSSENYKCDRRGYFTETVEEDGFCSYGERKE